MSLFKNVVLLALFLNSSMSFGASQCQVPKGHKEIDMRSEFGPIRDQGSIGWCYAFATSDLITHHMYKHPENLNASLKGTDFLKKENMLSPVALASSYNEIFKKDHYEKLKGMSLKDIRFKNMEILNQTQDESKLLSVVPLGGILKDAFDIAFFNGMCPEKNSPSESFQFSLGSLCLKKFVCGSDLQTVLEGIYESAGPDGLKVEENCSLLEVVKSAYPTIPEKYLKEIISKSSRDKIFYDLNRAACTKNYKQYMNNKPEIVDIAEGFFSNEKLFTEIDRQLGKGVSVGISYDGTSLQSDDPPYKPNHASVVVGKRLNPENCREEYIVRNSFGPNCLVYYKENPKISSCSSEKLRDDVWYSYSAIKPVETKIKTAEFEFKKNPTEENKKVLEQLKLALEQIQNPQNRAYLTSLICTKQNPPVPRNPGVSCDFKDGYLYVSKELLKKSLDRITFLK